MIPAEGAPPPSQKRRARLRLTSVALFGGACLFSLLLLEGLLRIYNPVQARVRGRRIVLLKNKRYTIHNKVIQSLESEITVTKNSLGFRGPDPPAPFGEYLTMFAVGGSTTHCLYISDEGTWPAVLGKRMSGALRKVWMNNAGLEGHSTFGHLILVEDILVPLRPKVALFLVGINDVARAPSEYELENVRSTILFNSPTAFLKSMSAYSEVAAVMSDLYRTVEAGQRGLIHHNLDLRRQKQLVSPSPDEDSYVAQMTGGAFLPDFENRLRRIVADCRAAGIEPVLITQPVLPGAGMDDATGVDLARVDVGDGVTGKAYWQTLEVYNDVTRRVARENNLMPVDLARQLPKSSRYFYDQLHFSTEGAKKVAEIVAADLCKPLQGKYPEYAAGSCAE